MYAVFVPNKKEEYMLNPCGVRVTVQLPHRVKVNGVNLSTDDSLAILRSFGFILLSDTDEKVEEGFAAFLLPPQWRVSFEKLPFTVIIDDTDKEVLFVFSSKTSKMNKPYISIRR